MQVQLRASLGIDMDRCTFTFMTSLSSVELLFLLHCLRFLTVTCIMYSDFFCRVRLFLAGG